MNRMLLISLLAVVHLFLTFWCVPPVSASDSTTSRETISGDIKLGDKFFKQRENLGSAQKAAGYYRSALQKDTRNLEVAWKLAYAEYWIGEAVREPDVKLQAYERGLEAAELAVESHPNRVEGYFFRGALNARKLSSTNNIFLLGDIKKDLRRAIELDPLYAGAGGYRVLGRLFHKLPAIAGGNNEEARRFLEKAVKIAPRFWMNHLFLAELEIDEGQNQRAIRLLYAILTGKAPLDQEPEFQEWKAEAEKILNKLAESQP